VRAVLEHQRAELDLMMAVAGIATIGEIVQTCWGPR
jgi:isopentenyl diphosphate isomerase/L-lactate dehydrogenase-like FMN-dependent dehydrogenase